MEIGYAGRQDRPALKEIWLASFPEDGPETADVFLDALLKPGWCLAGRLDGRAVTMAFLLPAELVAGKSALPLRYVFAAATLPPYRGRGCFGALLRRARELSAEQGVEALFLRPAEPGLAAYYERFGYRPYFAAVEETIRPAQVMGDPVGRVLRFPPRLEPSLWREQAEAAARSRDAALQGRPVWVRWPAEIVGLSAYGSLCLTGQGCYVMGGQEPAPAASERGLAGAGPSLFFREWVAGPSEAPALCAAACQAISLRAASLRAAEEIPPASLRLRRPARAGEAAPPFGWLCPLTARAEALFLTAAQDRPYMGLALD
ncbi:MAG TPA: GNAT family N-acetyltransferase [Firmicutes bacterium]|nr:GNAT family N-acetyltransferase [Bacillota bacterium]